MQRVALVAVFTLLVWQIMPTPELPNTGLQRAYILVSSNADWTPVELDFDGVAMVLVPAGCFLMGVTNEQIDRLILLGEEPTVFWVEQPPTETCLDSPYWIDKYEVTNAQFAQFDGIATAKSIWQDAQRPREKITWLEAYHFCALRGARLPTEVEWEYAARGPDNLIFPWGNNFERDNAVYRENSDRQTAAVGSKPKGVSWVGALDMSGNVWEWTTSLWINYPYASDHEDDASPGARRVIRGGSWTNVNNYMRTTVRPLNYSNDASSLLGFRCVRSIDAES